MGNPRLRSSNLVKRPFINEQLGATKKSTNLGHRKGSGIVVNPTPGTVQPTTNPPNPPPQHNWIYLNP